VPYRRITLEWLARSDESARFQTRGLLEWFRRNEPTIFPNDEASSSGVDDSHMGSKGGAICHNGNLVQNPAQKRNPDKEPSQEDSMVVPRLQ
jgi:hypothetical protein